MKYTYKQAFDLITEAYIKDEIRPYECSFCFCGTLANNTSEWVGCNLVNGYSGSDFREMESALLDFIGYSFKDETWVGINKLENHPRWEDVLFNGMCAALEVLKEIHRERGEDVDGVPEFTKRQLTVSHKQ
jgi:hypothetical protein